MKYSQKTSGFGLAQLFFWGTLLLGGVTQQTFLQKAYSPQLKTPSIEYELDAKITKRLIQSSNPCQKESGISKVILSNINEAINASRVRKITPKTEGCIFEDTLYHTADINGEVKTSYQCLFPKDQDLQAYLLKFQEDIGHGLDKIDWPKGASNCWGEGPSFEQMKRPVSDKILQNISYLINAAKKNQEASMSTPKTLLEPSKNTVEVMHIQSLKQSNENYYFEDTFANMEIGKEMRITKCLFENSTNLVTYLEENKEKLSEFPESLFTEEVEPYDQYPPQAIQCWGNGYEALNATQHRETLAQKLKLIPELGDSIPFRHDITGMFVEYAPLAIYIDVKHRLDLPKKPGPLGRLETQQDFLTRKSFLHRFPPGNSCPVDFREDSPKGFCEVREYQDKKGLFEMFIEPSDHDILNLRFTFFVGDFQFRLEAFHPDEKAKALGKARRGLMGNLNKEELSFENLKKLYEAVENDSEVETSDDQDDFYEVFRAFQNTLQSSKTQTYESLHGTVSFEKMDFWKFYTEIKSSRPLQSGFFLLKDPQKNACAAKLWRQHGIIGMMGDEDIDDDWGYETHEELFKALEKDPSWLKEIPDFSHMTYEGSEVHGKNTYHAFSFPHGKMYLSKDYALGNKTILIKEFGELPECQEERKHVKTLLRTLHFERKEP